MTTIKLKGIDFFAHHGYYQEERKIGNRYTVDIEVLLGRATFTDGDLDGTVNYEEIYSIVSSVMSVPAKLLETLASSICSEVLRKFPSVIQVNGTVCKHNPPIKGICKKASVSVTQAR